MTSRPGCTRRRRRRSARSSRNSCDGWDGCSEGCDAIGLFTLLWLALPAALVTPAPAGTPWAARWPVRLVVAYRERVSPTRPPVCPFTPTCSTYGLEALRRHGALRGLWLTLDRLRRCRPGAGGSDPVPRARARAQA
ncbi:membrane protein insertion efficiency factor YidD [Geodermatophilus sp. SYSU D00698]